VQVLNRQRGVRQNVTLGYDRLAKIMLKFLDACQLYGDVDGCKMMMVMVRSGRAVLLLGGRPSPPISHTHHVDDASAVCYCVGCVVQSETFFRVFTAAEIAASGSSPSGGNAAADDASSSSGTASGSAGGSDAVIDGGPVALLSCASPLASQSPHEFLQQRILHHPIWRNAAFWQEAFYRCEGGGGTRAASVMPHVCDGVVALLCSALLCSALLCSAPAA
jgi:hypothetical protein